MYSKKIILLFVCLLIILPLSARKKYVSKDKDFGEVITDGAPVYLNKILKNRTDETETYNEIIYEANIGETFIINQIESHKDLRYSNKKIFDCFQVTLPTCEKGWIDPVNFKKSGWRL
jgi:hypothetical protein